MAWEETDGVYVDPGFWDLGVRHGLSTKKFEGSVADHAGVMKFARTLGLKGAWLTVLNQVHGDKVVFPRGEATMQFQVEDGDGLATQHRLPLGVYFADCMPLMFFSPRPRSLGVAHAGWRGVQRGIVPRMVESIGAFGSAGSDIRVSIGPHIRACCFEVGEELREAFLPENVQERDGRLYVDLEGEVRAQLKAVRVRESNVSSSGECTSCNAELFHSFRRDKKHHRMYLLASL